MERWPVSLMIYTQTNPWFSMNIPSWWYIPSTMPIQPLSKTIRLMVKAPFLMLQSPMLIVLLVKSPIFDGFSWESHLSTGYFPAVFDDTGGHGHVATIWMAPSSSWVVLLKNPLRRSIFSYFFYPKWLVKSPFITVCGAIIPHSIPFYPITSHYIPFHAIN